LQYSFFDKPVLAAMAGRSRTIRVHSCSFVAQLVFPLCPFVSSVVKSSLADHPSVAHRVSIRNVIGNRFSPVFTRLVAHVRIGPFFLYVLESQHSRLPLLFPEAWSILTGNQ